MIESQPQVIRKAQSALIATYKRNPRNENRFASSNRHRTKKNAFSIFQGKGNTARDEPMLTYRSGGELVSQSLALGARH